MPEVQFPKDNPFSYEKWQLGKKLFFDPILSRDSSISCGSCHLPSRAFSDTVAFSRGVGDGRSTRNAPSLVNIAYHPYFMREGGVPNLELQVLVPIQDHNEMDFNVLKAAKRLNSLPEYVQLTKAAFDTIPTPYTITRSIATYERSLINATSRFDAFTLDGTGLNESEIRGKELFDSPRTNCRTCHSGFNFSSYAFENTGLYLDYEDIGRYQLTLDSNDIARFKVPSLRNVELTSPYMHDGSLATLEEVVAHYVEGGKGHRNQSPLVHKLDLSEGDIADLIAFLHTLTDTAQIVEPQLNTKASL